LFFRSPLVEIALELNSMRVASVCVEGEGIALGEADGSSEGLALETGEGREGKRGPSCRVALEFDDDSLAISGGAWRVIA